MMTSAIKSKNNKETYRIAPATFNIWLFILASSMLFAAFASAYIVHRPDAAAKDTWTYFELPVFFMYSAITAVVSSLTILIAWFAARKDELWMNRVFLGITLILGMVFIMFQYMGWESLVKQGLTFVNARPEDISASYVWVITFIHALHVLGGIILLAVALIQAFRFKIHKKQMVLMNVTHTYWHFVGLLWIYLYLFLYFAR